MTQLTPAEEFLLSLERERFNVAYRTPAETKKEVVEVIRWQTKPCTKEHVTKRGTEKRDQIFYHAGRYAQGARDRNAIEAQEQLEKLLED
jgi:hypothetical protein